MTDSPTSASQAGFAPLDAAKCFALALREAARPGLAFLSTLLVLATFTLWTIVFVIWWPEIISLATWAVDKSAAGLFNHKGVAGGSPATWSHPIAYVLATMAFVLLVMVTLRILLEWLLMSRIQRQCLKRYPHLRTGVESSMLGGLRDMIGPISTFIFGLACLLIPVLGGVLIFVLASYLNVRGLVNDAVDGLATDEQRRVIIKANRVQMTVLGVGLSLFMLIPFAGFFAPVVMGASVCHLCMRSLARQFAPEARHAATEAASASLR